MAAVVISGNTKDIIFLVFIMPGIHLIPLIFIRCIAQSSLASASFRVHFPFSPEHTLVIIKNHIALMLDEHSPCSKNCLGLSAADICPCPGLLPYLVLSHLPQQPFVLLYGTWTSGTGFPGLSMLLYCPNLGRWKDCISSPSCYAFDAQPWLDASHFLLLTTRVLAIYLWLVHITVKPCGG